MADTLTARLELTKPEIGSSENTWGAKINANFDRIDGELLLARSDEVIDINSITSSGVYRYSGAQAPVSPCTVDHRQLANGNRVQMALGAPSDVAGVMWVRRYTAGAWSGWSMVQPDRGSNVDGEFVRFPDGTMICTMSGVSTGSSASGALFLSDQQIWTFPVPFIAVPSVSMSVLRRGIWGDGFSDTLTNAKLSLAASAAGTGGIAYRAMAVGRWK